jgi:hypothetical protein
MRVLNFLALLLHLVSAKFDFIKRISDDQQEPKAAARAIIDIVDVFFVQRNITFNFYLHGGGEQRHRDIINEIGRQQVRNPKIKPQTGLMSRINARFVFCATSR